MTNRTLLSIFVAVSAAFAQIKVMVPMRDGVKLSTDVYLPEGGGKFPVLITRTPYDKTGQKKQALALAERKFVVVTQDVRGRFASEGNFYPFINEGLDGYDAIEWAAAQRWSNGQVGTYGGSYLGWDQYHAAMYKPPHLVAMFAIVGGAKFYDEYAFPGGIPNLGWASWILGSAASSQPAAKAPKLKEPLLEAQKNSAEWLSQPSGARGDVFRLLPVHEKIYRDFFAHPEFDSYWKQKGFWTSGYHKEMKDVPIFFITGWYDYFAEGVLDNFAGLAKIQKSPKQLIVGPWPHGIGLPTCGDASFGESAAVNPVTLIADWYDHVIRGKAFFMKEKVRLFRMGGGSGTRDGGKFNQGGEWRSTTAWPPPGGRRVRYYLHESGRLDLKTPDMEQPSVYEHDPENPGPTVGGRYGHGPTGLCAQDQPLGKRADTLSFQSAPLLQATEVTGRGKVHLFVGSTANSADFIVRLIDVHPNGYALLLAEGQIRTKSSKGEADFLLESTSNLFGAGHRIRIDIASSSFPRNETNPLSSKNSVFHDAKRASFVELPVY